MARKTFTPTYLGKWRARFGLTQQALADATDFSKAHISSVESGDRQYTQELLEAACTVFRRYLPNMEPADILVIDPDTVMLDSLLVAAARVPSKDRESAAKVLNALSDGPSLDFMHQKRPTPKPGPRPRAKAAPKRKRKD